MRVQLVVSSKINNKPKKKKWPFFEEEIIKIKGQDGISAKEEREYSSFPISSGYLCVRKSSCLQFYTARAVISASL